MKKITPFSLFIINQVRLRRLILGISARYLSLLLKHVEAYVSNIESSNNENRYPPHEWPKIAEALNCTVHDLLPAGQTESTGELIDKVVINLSCENDMILVLDGLIAHGFFAQPRTSAEVAKYLFIEKTEQLSVLEHTLMVLITTERLKFGQDGFVH